MISHLANLAVWEWFKVRRRWITWILLALLILFAAMQVWLRFGDYQISKDSPLVEDLEFVVGTPNTHNLDWKIDCEALFAGEPLTVPPGFTLDEVDVPRTVEECRNEAVEREDKLRLLEEQMTLPGGVTYTSRWTHFFAIPLLAFFTVLILGSEYGWGTLRTVLMKASGRWQYLSVKLGIVVAAALCAWVLVVLTIILSSLITAALAGFGSFDFLSWGFLGDTARSTLMAWYSGLPYIALAAAATIVFTASTTGGMFSAMAISMGYYFVDLLAMGRLLKLADGSAGFSWLTSVAEYDLGWNTAGWMLSENGAPAPGFGLVGAIGTARYPGDLHSFLIQGAYLLAFVILAFWLFARKDVRGPSGS